LQRSLTGAGVRETLARLQEEIALEIVEVPSGTKRFDWTVPLEWECDEAWIEDRSGKRVIDWEDNPLHLLGYSEPVDRWMSFDELKRHLHTLPQQPTLIPYRTLYYADDWGFALAHNQLEQMEPGEYRVVIRSRKFAGSMSYGELYLPGETEEECLFSTYICHPSMANDNVSGIVLLTRLAGWLGDKEQRRLSYRFLFAPETIGAICWLATCKRAPDHGVVATCVGDSGPLTYKRSRQGGVAIDRAAEQLLSEWPAPSQLRDFCPLGSDERQFCSPGFDWPVGSLMRTPYHEYPEYHTSGDDLSLISEESLNDSLLAYQELVYRLETNQRYKSLAPYGEPQLGRRGLYSNLGAEVDQAETKRAILWTLNLSDGQNDLLAIAERSGLAYRSIEQAARLLEEKGLIGWCG